MVVAAGVVDAVVDNGAHAPEGSGWAVRNSVIQPAAPSRGVDEIVSAVYLPGRACLEEIILLIALWDKVSLVGARQHRAHIGRVKPSVMGALEAVVDVNAAVIVHQYAGVVEGAAVACVGIIVIVLPQHCEGALRPVTDCHCAL